MPMLTTLRIALPVWPRHSPLRNHWEKSRHAIENLMNLVDDVDAIDNQCGVAGQAQCGVQDGPVLRDVDVLAREHGVTVFFQVRFSGQLNEKVRRLVGQAILGVVEVETLRCATSRSTAF